MPRSSNPLAELSKVSSVDSKGQVRPNTTFTYTALPGFKKVLNARRAMRLFDESPIPEDVMRDCLNDAILAPSSSNLQTYELYWVRDPARKSEVVKACLGQPVAETAGEIIVVVARVDLWRRNLDKLLDVMTHSGTRELPEPVDDYYHRIVPLLMRNDALGINNFVRRCIYWYRGLRAPFMRTPVNQADHRIYGHVQAALAAQTLLLSFAAHGYESCPLGGIDTRHIRRTLQLPRTAEPTMVIAAGRGKEEGLVGPRVRLDTSDLVIEI